MDTMMLIMTAKEQNEVKFRVIYNEACQAGLIAGEQIKPIPMTVGTPTSLFSNELDNTKPVYVVEGGVCGFASIIIKPGTSSFAKWLMKNALAHKHYYGGVNIWVSGFGQSMTRKEAYARAFSEVLKKYGINNYVESRMD